MKPGDADFGTYSEMTAILDMVRDPLQDAGLSIQRRYRWLPLETVDAFVAEVGSLGRGQVAEGERLTHAFVTDALRAKPEPPERARRRFAAGRRAAKRVLFAVRWWGL
jgi:hypothetical protein